MSQTRDLVVVTLLWLATLLVFALNYLEPGFNLVLSIANFCGVYFLLNVIAQFPVHFRSALGGLPLGLALIGSGELLNTLAFIFLPNGLGTILNLLGVVAVIYSGIALPLRLVQHKLLPPNAMWGFLFRAFFLGLVSSVGLMGLLGLAALQAVYLGVSVFMLALFVPLLFLPVNHQLVPLIQAIGRGLVLISAAQILLYLVGVISPLMAATARHSVWLLGVSLLVFYPRSNQVIRAVQWFMNASIVVKIMTFIFAFVVPYLMAVIFYMRAVIGQNLDQVVANTKIEVVAKAELGILMSMLSSASLLLPIVFLVVFAVGTSLSSRANALAASALALAQGDLNNTSFEDSSDEIGRIGVAFGVMTKYQQAMAAVATDISKGELSQNITPFSPNDTLGNAFSQMVYDLKETINQLGETAQQITQQSQEIFSSSTIQANHATAQNASVAQVSSTVSQVHASTTQIAEIAAEVKTSATAANQMASAGIRATNTAQINMEDIRERVRDIAQNILELSERTQAIGEIINTVSAIADQSNLLSLNAAIEAARAGEHGKGFSIVAGEIRLLAEQSKKATEEITRILREIQHSTNTAVMTTEQGIKSVDVGTQSIDSMKGVIEQLGQTLAEASSHSMLIQTSIQQHSIGMEQISSAVQHIHEGAAQFQKTSQSNQNATQDLRQLAERLRLITERYRLIAN
jgi:methyl-accepting chemotaxis protein